MSPLRHMIFKNFISIFRKEDAIDINIDIDDHYQISSTYLFEVIMKVK